MKKNMDNYIDDKAKIIAANASEEAKRKKEKKDALNAKLQKRGLIKISDKAMEAFYARQQKAIERRAKAMGRNK